MILSGYSAVENASDTLMHVTSIARFLRLHEWLWRAHVVNFFQGKLWEKVDAQWMACLRRALVEDWLLLPSGVVQEEWPDSLKEFVQTAFLLSLSRSPTASLAKLSSPGVPQAPIGSVLAQGMSAKKLHEIGILAALIAEMTASRAATDVIDVGAGQGYLALVLAFEYQLAVMAVDACGHHADVTNERALRIQKHYNARLRKARQDGLYYPNVRAPQTVTCRVGSGEAPMALASLWPAVQATKVSEDSTMTTEDMSVGQDREIVEEEKKKRCVVLAGLHACGDLSATMLRTFMECEEVTAVINVGCCYNLLSEESSNDAKESCGFPLSEGVGRLGLQLGRSARDLACQSAERWKEHHPDRALENFELHGFRAAFQLILERFYPETALQSPSVGRVGKSRRRRQARRAAMVASSESTGVEASPSNKGARSGAALDEAFDSSGLSNTCRSEMDTKSSQDEDTDAQGPKETSYSAYCEAKSHEQPQVGENNTPGLAGGTKGPAERKAARFEEYARSALERLDLPPLSAQDLRAVWDEVAPHEDLVGPFWSLRAVLAHVLESYILLDRLLYLKEQAELVAGPNGGKGARITAALVPLFDPSVSPRNMAVIAHRDGQ